MVVDIAVLPGDGIGPEVMEEGVKVLRAIEDRQQRSVFVLHYELVGGAAYVKHATHLPQETVQLVEAMAKKNAAARAKGNATTTTPSAVALNTTTTSPPSAVALNTTTSAVALNTTHNRRHQKDVCAVLFGSVGGPVDQQDQAKWKDAEKNSLLGLRALLQLSVNLRPSVVYPALCHLSPLRQGLVQGGVDVVVVRELASGIYFGKKKTCQSGEMQDWYSEDVMSYKWSEIEPVIRFAFETALTREHKLVTVVDKANVLDCSRLWRQVAHAVKGDYPSIEMKFMYVDNAAMQLVLNPKSFSVIVTANMFGDILSDLASVIPGSVGLMPSASLGANINMFEPAGGSAPTIAGQNKANPVAQILSVAMMLRYSFQMHEEAGWIESAVRKVLESGFRTADMVAEGEKAVGTAELGDMICAEIQRVS
eukprot:GHVS01095008.1.p1 GENE.GHVS01095008.1~~GHVS01095008.1.p1  ORF type:complete len:423 (-),score=92.75 GHVS01095008.1:440-1708(-)